MNEDNYRKGHARRIKKIKQRQGDDFFKKIGSEGGKKGGPKSTQRFDSELARKAANARWQKHREEKVKREKGQNGRNNSGEHL